MPAMPTLRIRRPIGDGGVGVLVRHGAIYVVGSVVQGGLAFLLLPALTRVLGVKEYGVAGTASAVGSLLTIVFGLGLSTAIVRLYYDDAPDSPDAGWAALIRMQAGVALVLALLAWLTGPLWSAPFHEIAWGPPFEIAIAYAWISALLVTAGGVLRAARRPVAFIVVTTVQLLAGTVLGILLATKWGASGYLAGLAIGAAAALAISLRATHRRARWSRSLIRGGVMLSLPAMAHDLSNWGLNLADRLLIAVYLGAVEVGRYQVAYILASTLMLLLTGLQSAWLPYYIGTLSTDARREAPRALMVPVSAAAALATALLVIAAPLLLALAAPSSFGGTQMIIALVAAGSIPRAGYFVASGVLWDQKKSKWIALASALGVLLNLALNIALIPTYGLVAAAAATDGAIAVQALVVILAAERLLNMQLQATRLCILWCVATVALLGIALLPDSATSIAVRLALLIVTTGGCAVTLRRVASNLRAVSLRTA